MNRFLFVTLLVIVVGCLCAEAAEKKVRKKEKNRGKCLNNICVDALGQSGKISFWKGTSNKKPSDTLVLSFDYIKEVDSDGNQLSGKAKHTFENFAKTDFLFSDLYETTVKGANATSFDFQAKLAGPEATLTVQIYIITKEKEIELCNGEKYTLKPGTVKFNVEIENWRFCGGEDGVDCGEKNGKNITGSYVDFAIEVKARENKKPEEKDEDEGNKKKGAKKYKLDDMDLRMPVAVEVDGSCKKLEDGYPNIKQQGSKQITSLRFPRFKSKLLYDPFVSSKASFSAKVSFMLIAFLASLVHLLY